MVYLRFPVESGCDVNTKIFEQVDIFNCSVIHSDQGEGSKVNGRYIGRATYHHHFSFL